MVRAKRMRRNPWGVGVGLFEEGREAVRDASGVCWEVVAGQEVLGEGRQPWEKGGDGV